MVSAATPQRASLAWVGCLVRRSLSMESKVRWTTWSRVVSPGGGAWRLAVKKNLRPAGVIKDHHALRARITDITQGDRGAASPNRGASLYPCNSGSAVALWRRRPILTLRGRRGRALPIRRLWLVVPTSRPGRGVPTLRGVAASFGGRGCDEFGDDGVGRAGSGRLGRRVRR